MKSNTNLLINNNDNNKQSIQINNKFNNPILENNAERIQELLESKKFVNSMKSIQESNLLNYDEIKLLPALFFDMQEALKKSNENILELRDSIKDKINIEKKLKNKIKEYEKEIKLLKDKYNKLKSREKEYKFKNEKLQYENKSLNQDNEFNISFQKKYEKIIIENNNLKKEKEDLISKMNIYENDINSLNKVKIELENKNKKYKNTQGIIQSEINNIEDHLKDIKLFQLQIKKMQNETNKMKCMIEDLETEKNNLKNDNFKLLSIIKSLKTEVKSELSEKISILNELNSFKMNKKNII